MSLEVWTNRANVCERVVTGTRTITETVRDPALVDAVPLVEVTREEEIVEWVCDEAILRASASIRWRHECTRRPARTAERPHPRPATSPCSTRPPNLAREQFTGPAEFSVRVDAKEPVAFSLREVEWMGVYPGMCRDREACLAAGFCPRDRSCCE